MASNVLLDLVRKQKNGIPSGIASFCTANGLVLEACFEQALKLDGSILVEATSNQVNQFGGYTGKRPIDYKRDICAIAEKVGFPESRIIFGGDHLGPLVWASEVEESAMDKAEDLVRLFVAAGYQKIHLDTSMRLGDDSVDEPLSVDVVARRGVRLYKACEEEVAKLMASDPEYVRPVYIIGSEVPIPGGEQDGRDALSVTSVASFVETIDAYKRAFASEGIDDAFDHIVGVVVQPGVEFGDDNIVEYDRSAAAELCHAVRVCSGIVMEGHSTDYQPAVRLKEMVEDGVAILKVGPALTFALRQGLFSLSMMENELIDDEQKRSRFMDELEAVMLEDDSNWRKYYVGTDGEKKLKRRYSQSDRCRYYFHRSRVQAAISVLFANIDAAIQDARVPNGLLRQYMPTQYARIMNGELRYSARDLVKDVVATVVDDYNFAVRCPSDVCERD